MKFILGAHGGAKGFNPFPKPRADRWITRQLVPVLRSDKERKTLVITPPEVLQPWQKHEAKLHLRRESHAGWNARREARERRRALEASPSP